MERRTFLKGAVVAASAPAIAAAPNVELNSAARLVLADHHAEPFAAKGDIVVFDEAMRQLENGAVYVTMTQKSQTPFVGRAWMDDTGHWWLERFARRDTYGPMTASMLRTAIQGRVQAVWKNIA